jgi:glycosyltransferase involved in cell wall biosynthesis
MLVRKKTRTVVPSNDASGGSTSLATYSEFSVSRVKIYILCHTQERLNQAPAIYSKYNWAVPRLMKYQDASFENAFWKQLLEMHDDWKDCDMVGAFSFKLYKKIDLHKVDTIIKTRQWRLTQYYHFLDTHKPIIFSHHPNLKKICTDIVKDFNVKLPTANYCNYWICSPNLMVRFIQFYTEEMRPYIFSHPLAFTNAKYRGTLTPKECMKIAGVPYYPHIPFVLERMNKCFFDKAIAEKPCILLVSHELSLTGAPIALTHLGLYLSKHTEYNIVLKSMAEFKHSDLNIPKLKAVCFNTLFCYPCIQKLPTTTTKILWYIYEWPDTLTHHNYPWLLKDQTVYDRVNMMMFPCQSAVNNFLKWAPWAPSEKCTILTNGYPAGRAPGPGPVSDKTILTIVGTIESRKNQTVFAEKVFAPLAKTFPQIELHLVGFNCSNAFKDCPSNIRLIGKVQDATPYIQSADIHVSYSINEVLPLNIIEAMRLGKAILATDVGGCSDLVTDNVSGYLIPVDAHDLAIARLTTLIENPELRQSFGMRAREAFLEKYEESAAFAPMIEYLSE